MTETPRRPDVSVVIPVYSGEGTLAELSSRLQAVADEQGWHHELILVCDQPRDGSWQVARELAAGPSAVRAVRLRRNFGQHPATLLGIRLARGRTVVTMDEDLQHDPRDVPALVEESLGIGGIAYGRGEQEQHVWWRNLASWLAKRFLALYLGPDMTRQMSAFRAFPVELREAFADYRGERVSIDVLLSWSGAPATVVRCAHGVRHDGRSGYTLAKLVAHLGNLLFGFSTAPLRMASWLGLAAVLLSGGLGSFVLLRTLLQGVKVPGFAFLALTISMLGGVQLLALGLVGEYLARLYFNSLGRPQYLVAEVVETAGGGQGVDASDGG